MVKLTSIRPDLLQRDTLSNMELTTKNVFSPVAHLDTIQFILAVAAQNAWPLYLLGMMNLCSFHLNTI